jgi:ribosome maturation protein SDO1
VSDKERKVHYDALFKDVASVLVQKCVNPETNRPYTGTMLERALRDAHFAVDPKRTAKQQALEVRARRPCIMRALLSART